MTADPRPPYPGPRPFEIADRPIFFGRDREARELKARIVAHPFVLLYAQSGAGKTSLINARIIPLLREDGFDVLPVTRVHTALSEAALPARAANIYTLNALHDLQAASGPPAADGGALERSGVPADETLASFLGQRARPRDEWDDEQPLVLILDQFEELFSAYPSHWRERRGFLEQLRDTVEQVPRLRVLIAMREDYLAHLDPYLEVFPGHLRIRMRLELLREPDAVRAVEGPLEQAGKHFAPGVAQAIVQELLQVRIRNEQGETVSVAGEFVEPVQLQVVCQTLWESLPGDLEVIDEHRLGAFGDVGQALGAFYDAVLKQAADHKAGEARLRQWIGEKLITPGGTRGIVNEQDEQTKAIPPQTIALLVSKHLLRGERRHGSRWFELAHDRFITPIQESNLRFAQFHQARQDARSRTESLMGSVGGIITAILLGYLLSIGSSAWITILCLLFSGVYSGMAFGGAIRGFRREGFSTVRMGEAGGLVGLLGAIAYLSVSAISTGSWWHLGGYFSLVGVYTLMFFQMMKDIRIDAARPREQAARPGAG